MAFDGDAAATLAALEGSDAAARTRALAALESGKAPFDDRIVARLVELLGDSSKALSRGAAGALARAAAGGHRAALERALEVDDARRRWGAAFALARAGMGGEAVLRVAVQALGTADGDVRWAAAEIVCALARESTDLRALVEDAARSETPARRKMALYCLRDLGHDDAATFVSGLADDHHEVRLAALAGLAACRRPTEQGVAGIVERMESDSEAGVRRAAAALLGRVAAGDARVTEALARARDASDDADFIRAASASLSRRRAARKEEDHG